MCDLPLAMIPPEIKLWLCRTTSESVWNKGGNNILHLLSLLFSTFHFNINEYRYAVKRRSLYFVGEKKLRSKSICIVKCHFVCRVSIFFCIFADGICIHNTLFFIAYVKFWNEMYMFHMSINLFMHVQFAFCICTMYMCVKCTTSLVTVNFNHKTIVQVTKSIRSP